MKKEIKVALAGNPNSGKTSVFNILTGSRQHIGNYPGVTVEKKEGFCEYKEYGITIIDLPGAYSLRATSLDELVARKFLIDEKPDVIVNVIDTSNLERNLYFSTQCMDLEIPMVFVFNMYDVIEKRGINIDRQKLSEFVGGPIIPTVASKNKGVSNILDEVIKVFEGHKKEHVKIRYVKELEDELSNIKNFLPKDTKYPLDWLAIKILEEDREILKNIDLTDQLKGQIEKSKQHLLTVFNDTPASLIADGRYGFISGACAESVVETFEFRHTVSDNIDKFVLNKIFGLPIFFCIVWLLFKFTFSVSEPFMKLIENLVFWFGELIGSFLKDGSLLQSLFVDGIISGVGGVIVFVPIIFLLFFAIAILEGSGYMARAAFLMDRFMHKIGLHGRSFIPMLLGFGCTVPAVMATRTIEDDKDRITTILITPFISCGARLPVYALLIGAFFPEHMSGNILLSLYILGIVVALFMAKILRKHVLKGEDSSFVMELPPYRVPALKGLFIHTFEKVLMYLKKAGTIIFFGCIIIWFLSNFPFNTAYSKDYDQLIANSDNEQIVMQLKNQKTVEKLEKSYAGMIGKAIVPILKPLGFGDWKIAVGLVGGLVAKEIFVGTLSTLYAIDDAGETLRESLQKDKYPDGQNKYNPLVAYALMVFVLLYVPCIAVLGVVKKETGSWKWVLFTATYTTLIAWTMAFVFYQGGRLVGVLM